MKTPSDQPATKGVSLEVSENGPPLKVLLALHRSQYRLTGIKFAGKYFVDKTLGMGASGSCYIFELFSNFINWILIRVTGYDSLDHYLDPSHPDVPTLYADKHFKETCERNIYHVSLLEGDATE